LTNTGSYITENLKAAGLAVEDVRAWLQAEPGEATDFPTDRKSFSTYWRSSSRLLGQLPPPPHRGEGERIAAKAIQDRARDARVRFLRKHADAVYDALTVRRSRFVRIEDLVIGAAGVVPGLVPTAQEIAAEEGTPQRDKEGLEIDQGLFLSAVLGSTRSGRHLCHAMLLPRPEAAELLPKFQKDGRIELAGASVHRAGKAAVVTQNNPRFLNAEDQTSLDGAEICVDLALLDPACDGDIPELDPPGHRPERLVRRGEAVDRRVKRVHVGTHSVDNEERCRALFAGLGWECRNDYGLGAVAETPYGAVALGDGVQTWLNPRLR